MTDKPLEQILDEFRQQIKEENKYSRRLARYAGSSFKYIKNSAKDLGSFISELYEEGTLKAAAKYSGIIAGGGAALAGLGYGAYKFLESYGGYVVAGSISGTACALAGIATSVITGLKLTNLNMSQKQTNFCIGVVGGIFGSGAGAVINYAMQLGNGGEHPFSAGILGGCACLVAFPAGLLQGIKDQQEKK